MDQGASANLEGIADVWFGEDVVLKVELAGWQKCRS
jgi:hypothetical protein